MAKEDSNIIRVQRYVSPCGELLLGAWKGQLCLCNWSKEKHPGRVEARLQRLLGAAYQEETSDVTREAARQLDEYFKGERQAFDLPLIMAGSDFQQRVWQELLKIPYGGTISYGELAKRIGQAQAVRAVANANGANALSIFIPCHRVIGAMPAGLLPNNTCWHGNRQKAIKSLPSNSAEHEIQLPIITYANIRASRCYHYTHFVMTKLVISRRLARACWAFCTT